VPAFRIKQDVLPGRYTTMWFRPTKVGTYHLFCAEYCGTLHSGMIGEVTVMPLTEYDAWLHGNAAAGTMVTDGQRVFAQLGCSSCHRSDTQGRGPSLAGVYGHQVALDDGQTVVANENYVRESIMNPGAQVVAGFTPIMPTYNGIVSEDQMLSLMQYIKSLSQPQSAESGSAQQPATANPGGNNAPRGGNKKVK